MQNLIAVFMVFVIMTIVFAVPFIGMAFLWIFMISNHGIPGLIISTAATMAMVFGWWITAEAVERRRNSRW
jgi:hypothetical protein